MMQTDKLRPLSRQDIEDGLNELGVSTGMAVEVHSSLSSFGYVIGGAETVVNALLHCVGSEGAIIMSAYPVSKPLPLTEEDLACGLTCKVRIFPEDLDEASGMGVIADAFRRRQDVILGKGIHRVASWGKDAHLHAACQYAHLLAIGGYSLLLGVDVNRLSSMHSAESCIPRDLSAEPFFSSEILSKYPPDQWYVEVDKSRTEAKGRVEVSWEQIRDEACQKGSIRKLMIGNAKCMFFKTNDMVGLYKDALVKAYSS